jgi:hypothetical protein
MAKYRFLQDGYFMGKCYKIGDEVDLNPRQAKYALLSGQLEALVPLSAPAPEPKAAPKKTLSKPPTPGKERSTRRTVGGGMGAKFSPT